MARIYVHIGLPKTATTTLQRVVFPSLSRQDFRYIGVLQPRSRKQDPFFLDFYEAVCIGQPFSSVRAALDSYLRRGTSILLSEESILVSQSRADWRTKLANLSRLLSGLDYELILTVRQPELALFSYYVELLPLLLRESRALADKRGFVARAKHDPSMEVFHYRKLLDELATHFDSSRIFVKKFEEIIGGELRDLMSLLSGRSAASPPARLEKVNQRKSVGGLVYTGKRITVGDVVRCSSPRGRRLGVRLLEKLLISLAKRMDRFSLWEIKVAQPSQDALAEVRAYLKDDVLCLKNRFGIALK